MHFNKLVFPIPFFPTIPNTSPLFKEILISLNMRFPFIVYDKSSHKYTLFLLNSFSRTSNFGVDKVLILRLSSFFELNDFISSCVKQSLIMPLSI